MINIAIYCRKSVYSDTSDSVEAQYEFGVEYAKAHYTDYHLFRYTDEGFTGANTDRPKFAELVSDIKNSKIDVVICYRIDRVSRNVLDFSTFYNLCTDNNVDFVSMKEQIDTTTPLGRAMLYVSSAFAQMERETISERVRDSMIHLAESGKWMGGKPPIGYDRKRVEINGKTHTMLVKKPEELPYLNKVFDTFLEGYSLNGLATYFKKDNVKSLLGNYLSASQLHVILKNPHYCAADQAAYDYFKEKGCSIPLDRTAFDGKHGIIVYRRTSGGRGKKHVLNPSEQWIICIGLHEPLFASDKWLLVQKRFGLNTIDKTRKHYIGILKGILRCGNCGRLMRTRYKYDKCYDKTYKHYFCQQRNISGKESCNTRFVRIADIDDAVIKMLTEIKLDKKELDKYIAKAPSCTVVSRSKSTIQKDIKTINNKIKNLTSTLSENSTSAAAKYIIAELESLDKQLCNLMLESRAVDADASTRISIESDKEKKYIEVCELVGVLKTSSYLEINDMLKKLISECVYVGEKLIVKL